MTQSARNTDWNARPDAGAASSGAARGAAGTMTRGERIVSLVGIWLAVYPSVLFFSYLIKWLGLDWPLYLEILVSTAVTVPLISYLAVPAVRKIMAGVEGKDEAELKE